MKTEQELKDKVHELLTFANAATPQEQADLGAVLISVGTCLMNDGGVDVEVIKSCVEQTIRVSNGLSPLPSPGSLVH